jgi:hypothetical protein
MDAVKSQSGRADVRADVRSHGQSAHSPRPCPVRQAIRPRPQPRLGIVRARNVTPNSEELVKGGNRKKPRKSEKFSRKLFSKPQIQT